MRPKGIPTLIALLLLSLPSMVGMFALLLNRVAGKAVESWGTTSSLAVAVAAMFGMPLTILAIAVSAPSLLGRKVSPEVKLADVVILGAGMFATLFVSFRVPV